MNIFRKGLRRLVNILGEYRISPPLLTICMLHLIERGYFPNLSNPKELQEKLIWLSYNSDTSKWSQLADKYEVRKYIKDRGLEEYLIPILGIYDKPEDINFSILPDNFVIKSTNGSGQIIIVDNKEKKKPEVLRKTIKGWFKKPYGLSSGEPHYLKVPPRIIIEEFIRMSDGTIPIDYKFYCFNGKVDSCLVLSGRDIESDSYNINLKNPFSWEEIPDAIEKPYLSKTSLGKPENLDKMIEIASLLSKDFKFVRVDLYNVNGKIYFGELTFTPAGCRLKETKRSYLKQLGDNLQL